MYVTPIYNSRYNKKLSYRRETARQLRTSFSARSLIVHFTEHRISCTTIDKVVSTLSANKPSPYTWPMKLLDTGVLEVGGVCPFPVLTVHIVDTDRR